MIKQIRITNFKVVQDSGLLPLQLLTAIIGRNGSGKSSLIEALDWLGHAVVDGAQTATEPFRRVRDLIHQWSSDDPDRTFGITLVFEPQDISAGTNVIYSIEVGAELDGERAIVRSEELSANIRGVQEVLVRTDPTTRIRQFRQDIQAIEDYLRPRLAPSRFEPVLGAIRNFRDDEVQWGIAEDSDRLAIESLSATGNPVAVYVRDFLARLVVLRLNPRVIAEFAPAHDSASPRLLDDQGARLAALLGSLNDELRDILVEKLTFILERATVIEDHRPTNPGDRRFFTLTERVGPDVVAATTSEDEANETPASSGKIEVPAWTLSEGTRRVTAILAVLLHESVPQLVCIEELENGLDPWTMKYLLDEISGAAVGGTQMLITSHSPYLMNLLPLETIMFCNRNIHNVEYSVGDQLPDQEVLLQRMGPGDLYTSRYFHRRSEEGEQ